MTLTKMAPCEGCSRHVRVGGEACPFCGASTASLVAPEPRRPRGGRWTRAALMAGSALLGTAALGCGSSSSSETTEQTETTTEDTSGSEGSATEGGAAEGGATEEGATGEGGDDEPDVRALYGGPPAEVIV
jgi:hypothetical protein